MKFCGKCGAQMADVDRFCGKCGTLENVQAVQPPVQQPPMNQQTVQTPDVPGKGLGIASMVLGIVSLVLFCLWYMAIPCGVVGVILGAISATKAKEAGMTNGMASAGLICSCITLGLMLLLVIVTVAGAVSFGFVMGEMLEGLY